MESRPTARLIGTALRGDGLRAEVIVDAANGATSSSSYGDGAAKGEKGTKKKVLVMLEHSTLGERGCFAIGDDGSGRGSDSDGRIGELAMKMMLANLQASAAIAPSSDTAAPAAAAQGTIAFDPAMENELRKVFEDWWDRASGGDVTTMGHAEADVAAAAAASLLSDKLPSGDVIAHESDELGVKTVAAVDIGDEVSAPPPTKTNNDVDRSTGVMPRGSASSVPAVEGHADQRPAGSAKENQEEDRSALTNQKSSAAAVESPPQQQKKRKAPGPILVRAGGGVGGGRKKKKKGKITIGKA
mmetsp:Transcript_16802/g.36499  ORF Transcript_16802/g.36499 Transcript_16802/m.36499 type:complete len:300 (+) Transcript_16802:3-902(+)